MAQDHYNPRFKRELSLVHNYQLMMDKRLSMPKNLDAVAVEVNTREARTRFFRNSSPDLQLKHQQVFYKTANGKFASPEARGQLGAQEQSAGGSRTFDKSYTSYGKQKVFKA